MWNQKFVAQIWLFLMKSVKKNSIRVSKGEIGQLILGSESKKWNIWVKFMLFLILRGSWSVSEVESVGESLWSRDFKPSCSTLIVNEGSASLRLNSQQLLCQNIKTSTRWLFVVYSLLKTLQKYLGSRNIRRWTTGPMSSLLGGASLPSEHKPEISENINHLITSLRLSWSEEAFYISYCTFR